MTRTTTTRRSHWLCATAAVSLAAITQPAAAQDAQASADTNADEILVVGTKTGESLDRSAVSAVVIGGDDLARAQIRTTEDIALRTPSLVFSTQQQRSLVFMRGVGSSFSLAGAESAVSTYVDGTYIQRQGGSTLGLVDVESVQALRGPQSVLLGRNATGGAISIQTRNPTQKTEASFDAEFGRFESYRAQAMVNLPLSEMFALRVVALTQGNDPTIRNLGSGKDIGEDESNYIRAKIAFTPTPEFTAILTGEYYKIKGTPLIHRQVAGTPCLACIATGSPGIPANAGFYDISTDDRIGDFYDKGLDGHGAVITTKAAYLTLNYDGDTVVLNSVTGYRHQRFPSRSDNDHISANFFGARVDETGPTFTQDAYLRTKFDGAFNMLVGAFYENEKNQQAARFTGSANGGVVPGQTFLARVHALSLYGDAWYNFTPELRVTAGVRWTRDKKTTDVDNNAVVNNLVGAPDYSQERTFKYATPHAVISYETNGQYYYASYAEGVRSGFFTSPTFVPLPALNPERLKNWEIGAKNNFMNGVLRTNVSVFYGTFNNMIVQFNDPQSGGIRAQNAAKAELYGAELEVTVQPSRNLTITAGAAYLHNHFVNFENAAIQNVGCAVVVTPPAACPAAIFVADTEDLSGEVVPRAPRFSGNLAIDWTVPFENGWSIASSFNMRYQSRIEFTAGAGGELRLDQQKRYALANLQVTLNAPDDRFYIRGFVRNLFSTKYRIDAATEAFAAFYSPGPRQVFGVGVGGRF